MTNTWLLTWTTYGTWLPGDRRGSVTRVREGAPLGGPRVEHDQPGTPYVGAIPGIERSVREKMRGEPVWLTQPQAETALAEFRVSGNFRGWTLHAAALMANHAHVVIGAIEEVSASKLMQVLKSYASRRLNAEHGKRVSGTWWTQSGSKRRLPDERAVGAAVRYVRNQHRPLAMFIAKSLETSIEAVDPSGGR